MKSLLFIFAITISAITFAKEAIVESGFKAFKEGGANAAWPAWAKGGKLDGSKELMAQASQFGTVAAYYGNYVSHEYISEKRLGSNNKVLYVIMNMDSGPLYGVFYLYKLPSGNWSVPNFMFNIQDQQVWPQCMYSVCGG